MKEELFNKTKNLKFSKLVKSEFRKTFDTTTSKTIIGVIIFLTICMFVLSIFRYKEATVWTSPFVMLSNPSVTLLPIIFILLVCEEFTKGTALITYTFVPDRKKVILAKLSVLMITFSLIIVVLMLLTLISSIVSSSMNNYLIDWNVSFISLFKLILPLLINLLFGFSIAVFTKESTIALGMYFVIPPITVLATQLTNIGKFFKWISLEHSSSLFIGGATGVNTLQFICSAVFWVLVPLLLGIYRNRVMDIS